MVVYLHCVYSPAQTVQCKLNAIARPIILGLLAKDFYSPIAKTMWSARLLNINLMSLQTFQFESRLFNFHLEIRIQRICT